MGRNRSEGWQYAKITGHLNEEDVAELLKKDLQFQKDFLRKIKKTDRKIENVEVGGKNEKNVECILGGKTKSKSDLKIFLDDDSKYGISIKKSLGGQVFLIGVERFIKGFEKQYEKKISNNVKEAISLFWGTSPKVKEIISEYTVNKEYELKKNRLVSKTLLSYDSGLYNELLKWFSENIQEITDFCFSRGLAKNKEDYANYIWYSKEKGENIFSLKELQNAVSTSEVTYGIKNFGTTIQLPFGFVQWHSPKKIIPGQIQFHHNYKKITKLLNKD